MVASFTTIANYDEPSIESKVDIRNQFESEIELVNKNREDNIYARLEAYFIP